MLRRHIRYNTGRPKGLMGLITEIALGTSFLSMLEPSFLTDLYHYGNRRFCEDKTSSIHHCISLNSRKDCNMPRDPYPFPRLQNDSDFCGQQGKQVCLTEQEDL